MQQIPRPPRPPAARSIASVALDEWLTTKGYEQQFLVEKLGVSSTLISFYVRGLRVPLGERAKKIEKLTDGAVRVGDWRMEAPGPDQGGQTLRAPTSEELRAGIKRLERRVKPAR